MNTLFLNSISSFFVCAGIIIAIVLIVSLIRHSQTMKIMNAVWVLTALWGHYFALFAYFSFGIRGNGLNASSVSHHIMNLNNLGMKMDMPMSSSMSSLGMEENSRWQSVTLSTLHCGAGCVLADLVGEWFTYFVPIYIGGSLIAGTWVLDFILALIFGVFFQFAAIREMEQISFREAISRAFKADFLSLTAWQIGMYGWMAIVYFAIFTESPLEKNSWTFWFMMQIAMCFGFLFSYPVNAWLIRMGVKKAM